MNQKMGSRPVGGRAGSRRYYCFRVNGGFRGGVIFSDETSSLVF